MRWLTILTIICYMGVVGPAGPVAGAVESNEPRAVVEDLLETIRRIDAGAESVSAQQFNETLTHASSLIDVQAISSYALSDHWQQLGPDQQRTFVDIFTRLLETVAYPNTAEFLSGLEVNYRKEKTVRTKAMIYTSVMHQKEGRVDVDFKLRKGGNAWLVTDVYLDGVSLSRNLRTQCLKIIRDHSYEELLRRMEKKLRDKDSEDFGEITSRY